MSKISVVAFDLGHVVLDADIPTQIKKMGITEPWESIAQWNVHWEFETGKLSTEDFFKQVKSKFNLSCDEEHLRKSWDAILLGYVPGMKEVLNELSKNVRIVAITNTNAPHFNAFHTTPGFENFEKIFASHLVGFRKPDKEIYQYVLNDLKIPAQEMIFFDDLKVNIEMASSLGIRAYQCYRSAETVRKTLRVFNLLK